MYIVVRGDIHIPAGKLAAQAAHAAVRSYTHALAACPDVVQHWFKVDGGNEAKIVLMVPDLAALHQIFGEAKAKELPSELVEDAGRTVFTEPTVTCVGIGPIWREHAEFLKGLPIYKERNNDTQ